MLTIAIYTHSDYFDILPVQLAYFNKVVTGATVTLFTNIPYPECEYQQILYDDSLPYAGRLLSCISQLSSTYFLLTHENDIVCAYDPSFLEGLVAKMEEHGIDTIDLKHESQGSDPIHFTDEVALVKKAHYFYCVQPSLWKRSSLEAILTKYSDRGYRQIEQDDVQKYMVETWNVRGIVATNSIQTIWYRVSPYYAFIHLTSRLLLLPCKEENGLEASLHKEHQEIFAKYFTPSARGVQETIYSFDNRMVEANPI
jgi:hypothetical protein